MKSDFFIQLDGLTELLYEDKNKNLLPPLNYPF
jgi:hypothetical protein